MAFDPKIRASDEDRDRTATLLREHYAVGRLTPDEYNERLDRAYAATTVGDLDELTADMPGIDLYRLPDASLTRQPRQVTGRPVRARRPSSVAHLRAAWGAWFSVSLLCFVIWAFSGFGYPWPLWVIGPWGAIMLGQMVTRGIGGGPPRQGLDPGGSSQGELPGDRDE